MDSKEIKMSELKCTKCGESANVLINGKGYCFNCIYIPTQSSNKQIKKQSPQQVPKKVPWWKRFIC